ncbi:putative endogenous retrovirus group FC1 Env polyprotein [Erinaceus europaeus]|uniref:Endogenous retrovirus group FC1 Env polyprotein n=1 Tax=Erinaceus europaeus TaxID=9365 RepID=A0ABM3XW98_ERIEU|nr:putative endogenous retrovirus group FC1 Env polyprotein [Erinaceus europaeus]
MLHRTLHDLSGSLHAMSAIVQKMAWLSVKNKRHRICHRAPSSTHNETWKDLKNLVQRVQGQNPPTALLSPIALSAYLILFSALPTPASSSPVFIWQFQVRETYGDINKIIGTGNCSLKGCQSSVTIPVKSAATSPCVEAGCPYVCFPFDNSGNCLTAVDYYGGYCYWSCKIHGIPSGFIKHDYYTIPTPVYYPSRQYFSGIGSLKFIIHDPWDNRWVTGVTGKLYCSAVSISPAADIFISRQTVSPCL